MIDSANASLPFFGLEPPQLDLWGKAVFLLGILVRAGIHSWSCLTLIERASFARKLDYYSTATDWRTDIQGVNSLG